MKMHPHDMASADRKFGKKKGRAAPPQDDAKRDEAIFRSLEALDELEKRRRGIDPPAR